MPFSSSICLTNIGTLPLGSNVNIYSNANNYSPAFQTNVSLSSLTSNCPYILTNIPDGTTEIKFEDTVSHCCYNLIISPNNLCDLFDIQISGFSATTISQIVAGQLISSVGANITDYVIDWYGPDNNTTVEFTSGFGTEFTNVAYQQTHPFTRMSLPGYYVPMIRQIRINGINYSITGGTGFVQANIDCLKNQTVQVFPSNCVGNRQDPNLPWGDYNNFYFSNGAAFNAVPESLSLGFDLDINTNYFAWQFRPETVSDTIKLRFVSDNYPLPGIVLEYWTVGDEYTETNFTTQPKVMEVYPSTFFKKITNLTKFLRSETDKIFIEITPNPTISRTNWELYFKCLDTFDCETCVDTTSLPYKLVSNSISFNELSCDLYNFSAKISGCPCSIIFNTDLYRYVIDGCGFQQINGPSLRGNICGDSSGIINWGGTLYLNSVVCYLTPIFNSNNDVCDPISGGVTTFIKDNSGVGGIGNIYMTFELLSDLEIYYNSYLNNVVAYGLGTPFNNTNLDYYRFFYLDIVVVPSNDTFRTCASDVSSIQSYQIHTSSVVTTGFTETVFWMNVTMPTTTYNMSFDSCDLGCVDATSGTTIDINQNSLSQLNQQNFISSISAKRIEPFSKYFKVAQANSTQQPGTSGDIVLNNVINETIPMSGSTYTPIPSLSATTCDISTYISENYMNPLYPYTAYRKSVGYYYARITISNTIDIVYNSLATPLLVYSYNLTTQTLDYINDSYFTGPNIILTSSSFNNGNFIAVGFKNNTYCSQLNNSPQMSWYVNTNTLLPTQTITSYEILCEDLDASNFIHWKVTGINPNQTSITQNGTWTSNTGLTVHPTGYPSPSGDRVNGWNGPCPPSGTHNYRVQVTARLSDNTAIISNYLTFKST